FPLERQSSAHGQPTRSSRTHRSRVYRNGSISTYCQRSSVQTPPNGYRDSKTRSPGARDGPNQFARSTPPVGRQRDVAKTTWQMTYDRTSRTIRRVPTRITSPSLTVTSAVGSLIF